MSKKLLASVLGAFALVACKPSLPPAVPTNDDLADIKIRDVKHKLPEFKLVDRYTDKAGTVTLAFQPPNSKTHVLVKCGEFEKEPNFFVLQPSLERRCEVVF